MKFAHIESGVEVGVDHAVAQSSGLTVKCTYMYALSSEAANGASKTLELSGMLVRSDPVWWFTVIRDEDGAPIFSFQVSPGSMGCCGVYSVGKPSLVVNSRAVDPEVTEAAVNIGISAALRHLSISALVQADHERWTPVLGRWKGAVINMPMAVVNMNSRNPINIFAFVRKGCDIVPNTRYKEYKGGTS